MQTDAQIFYLLTNIKNKAKPETENLNYFVNLKQSQYTLLLL